jgi:hypothetical protein
MYAAAELPSSAACAPARAARQGGNMAAALILFNLSTHLLVMLPSSRRSVSASKGLHALATARTVP